MAFKTHDTDNRQLHDAPGLSSTADIQEDYDSEFAFLYTSSFGEYPDINVSDVSLNNSMGKNQQQVARD